MDKLTVNLCVTYTAVVVHALVPIWIGSHKSLTNKTKVEALTKRDAALFPVIGSAVLLGLYVVLQLLPPEYVNYMLGAYFCLLGTASIGQTLKPVLSYAQLRINGQTSTKPHVYCFAFKLFTSTPLWTLKFDLLDAASIAIGVVVSALWFFTKNWIANNVIALSLAIEAISLIALGSFGIGAILLMGLFVYDIFWVFGTSVMVSVATKIDGPIKLLFPKNGLFAAEPEFALLGLGDIVLPGVFLALMLRFDAKLSRGQPVFDKVYFVSTFFAYFAGLVSTIGVMHFFQAAQPALLYLVPACLGTSLLVGLLRGQLRRLIFFSEEKENKKKKSKTKQQ